MYLVNKMAPLGRNVTKWEEGKKKCWTIQKFSQRLHEWECIDNNRRSRRNQITTVRSDTWLPRLIKQNRRHNFPDLLASLNELIPTELSQRTLKRTISDLNYKRCALRKRLTIAKTNRESCVKWCRDHRTTTVDENLEKIIFTHETQIVLGRNRKYVWRKRDEAWNHECLGQSPRSNISVMFWGCIACPGVGVSTKVEGRLILIQRSTYIF